MAPAPAAARSQRCVRELHPWFGHPAFHGERARARLDRLHDDRRLQPAANCRKITPAPHIHGSDLPSIELRLRALLQRAPYRPNLHWILLCSQALFTRWPGLELSVSS